MRIRTWRIRAAMTATTVLGTALLGAPLTGSAPELAAQAAAPSEAVPGAAAAAAPDTTPARGAEPAAGEAGGNVAATARRSVTDVVPPIDALAAVPASGFAPVVERYSADRAVLLRRYGVPYSATRRERLRDFFSAWQAELERADFEALDRPARIDYILLSHRLRREIEALDEEDRLFREIEALIPFAGAVIALQERRRDHEPVEPRAAADALDRLAGEARDLARSMEAVSQNDAAGALPTPIVGSRAERAVRELRETLDDWYGFYAGYDPVFTWWVETPYTRAVEAMDEYAAVLRERVVGHRPGEPEPIIGEPIGAEALTADLAVEMIPYSPEELIAIAERELAWGEAEMRRAAREMGFGDDWRAALEKVKTLHVEPGEQRLLVRDLARQAEEFLEERGLLTIPPLAREVWRMNMLSPEMQRIAPFFLGGEVVRVAFPTADMEHQDKLMSLRGNNVHFSRAVVHHELIPGHHLQGFMTSRFNTHRQAFSTPFWGEGWALYWEMLLYEEGFPRTLEDRVGMLFWRNHRAARIIFSLGFHLGSMTPDEAIEFLVERVGHERANAEAEVRRSFGGRYSPLYQAAYLIGGLQFYALYDELVRSGPMSAREFHDAILQGGRIPVEMVRALLTDVPLSQDYAARWRFAGDPPLARRP